MFRLLATRAAAARHFSPAAAPSATAAGAPVFAWLRAMSTAVPIDCKALVAFGVNDLREVDIVVAPPKAGEVRVKVVANALCHTDVYTLGGDDPEGLFPSILGHEAGAIVEAIGEGVTSVKVGDHVVPGYTPQCKEPDCIFCMSEKSNLCPKIRATQGAGVMPDGTSRFTLKEDGSPIFHFMGCSTFAEYTVLAEISCAVIDKKADLSKVCLFGCGVSTGMGAVWNNSKVEKDSSVAVFGLGAIGLAVIQAAKESGAKQIIGVDINSGKFDLAKQVGATDCVNSAELGDVAITDHLIKMSQSGWGIDYTFECTGNTKVMREALESSHRGWGKCCCIGVAAAGHEISTRPFNLIIGREWIGTAFGGFKTRDDIPKLVNRQMDGSLNIDHYITHEYKGVGGTIKAIEALHSGDCLRAVVTY